MLTKAQTGSIYSVMLLRAKPQSHVIETYGITSSGVIFRLMWQLIILWMDASFAAAAAAL